MAKKEEEKSEAEREAASAETLMLVVRALRALPTADAERVLRSACVFFQVEVSL